MCNFVLHCALCRLCGAADGAVGTGPVDPAAAGPII